MDEYAKEISDLAAQIDAMIEEEADKKEIAELQMQLEILRTLSRQATHLLESGRRNPELRESLALRGYGRAAQCQPISTVNDLAGFRTGFTEHPAGERLGLLVVASLYHLLDGLLGRI